MELVKERLFEYALIWHPNKEQSKDGQRSKIVLEPKLVLGADDKSVGMKAIKAIPAEYDEQLEQIEVVVKPF